MAQRLFSAEPLSEPMMTYQLDTWEQIKVKIFNENKFSSKKLHLKICMPNGGYFVLTSMYQYVML